MKVIGVASGFSSKSDSYTLSDVVYDLSLPTMGDFKASFELESI